MVGRKKRRSGDLMGNHQRCWLWGRHAVLELLRAGGAWRPLELWLDADLPAPVLEEVRVLLAAQSGPAPALTEAQRLRELCGTQEHQGFVAKLPPYPYGSLSELPVVSVRTRLLVLDAIQDPFNFGAILRSADVFGIDAVIVGNIGQAEVNSQVVRSSAGAVHHVRLIRVDDLPACVRRLRELGLTVAGAAGAGEQRLDRFHPAGPVAVVIGNEGRGVAPEVLSECDVLVSIPQQGHVSSLNAAVAAGVLLYALTRSGDAGSQPGC